MNRRIDDKTDAKILFNDLPDDELDCVLDFDLSSDDDNFMKTKSEVLWSRDFEYPDSFEKLSELTGRTLSSCSWHNDDFDMKSTNKVKASLEAIDNALYERVQSPFISENIFQECCDWAEKFPYFRVKGEHIQKPLECNFISNSIFSENSSTSLHLEGQRLPLHNGHKLKGGYFDNANGDIVSTCNEEYLVFHESDQSDTNILLPGVDYSVCHSSAKALQEKVIDVLVSDMWTSVLSFLGKLDDKKHGISDFQLPPILNSSDEQKALSLQRPKTEGGLTNTEFPKLENILSVSPKILQKRHFRNGGISRIARPSSEMSVHRRTSSKSIKSVYHGVSSAAFLLNCDSSAAKGNGSESENMCLVLPALEEDLQDCSSILRGYHIEPERKEAAKSNLPTENENEMRNSSRESEYFLPPIEDKNYLASNIKLTKNLFTFYGTSDENKTSKLKKRSPRSSTSLSKKAAKNYEVTSQFTVTNGLYITSRNLSETSASCTEQSLDLVFKESESEDTNREKSVTLFPIVTSLTPHEEKRGLRTFLGGKKR